MERSADAMSTWLQQRVVMEILTAEKVNPIYIHCGLQGIYDNETAVHRSVSHWATKC